MRGLGSRGAGLDGAEALGVAARGDGGAPPPGRRTSAGARRGAHRRDRRPALPGGLVAAGPSARRRLCGGGRAAGSPVLVRGSPRSSLPPSPAPAPRGQYPRAQHVTWGTWHGLDVEGFEYWYAVGSDPSRNDYRRFTCVLMSIPASWPDIVIEPQRVVPRSPMPPERPRSTRSWNGSTARTGSSARTTLRRRR